MGVGVAVASSVAVGVGVLVNTGVGVGVGPAALLALSSTWAISSSFPAEAVTANSPGAAVQVQGPTVVSVQVVAVTKSVLPQFATATFPPVPV